jgi:hypothetical protein
MLFIIFKQYLIFYTHIHYIMMKKLLLLFLATSMASCSKDNTPEPEPPLSEIPDVEQMEIIGKMTGEEEIEAGCLLSSRASEDDKLKVRTYFKDIINQLSLTPMEQAYESSLDGELGTNIYTILPSTNGSDEYIVLGAHYDTDGNSPGANHNASGVALAYTVVKKLSELDTRNKNILLAFFDDGQGYRGSRAFAAKIKAEGLNVHSAHTVDQIGWDSDEDKAIEIERPTEELKAIYEAKGEELGITIHTTNVGSTDHSAFRSEGYNAIGLTEEYRNGDTTPHINQPTDTYNTVNFEYLASSTDFTFRVMRHLLSE